MVYVKLRDYFKPRKVLDEKILYYSVLKSSRGKLARAFFGGEEIDTLYVYRTDTLYVYRRICSLPFIYVLYALLPYKYYYLQ